MIVSLAGFMGCGKSSVGKILSEMLSCPLIDLDTYIEETDGRTISEIFSDDGEEIFREMELFSLRDIVSTYGNSDETLVLSLGGGTLTTEECASIVSESTKCFYLRASVDTLVENLNIVGVENRPMLNGHPLRERIEELMESREEIYEEYASRIIDIDGMDSRQIALEIQSLLGE